MAFNTDGDEEVDEDEGLLLVSLLGVVSVLVLSLFEW